MKKITKTQEHQIILLYKEMLNCKKVAETLKINVKTVLRYLGLNKIRIVKRTNSKYRYKENYFDEINTEDKAYFLGLMYADGYISKNGNMCCIALQEEDIDILNKFNSYIESTRPITTEIPRKKHWKNMKRLVFSGESLKNGLIKNGCINKKSLTLKFPTEEQVPKHLLKHFIRGYFDGDGHINEKAGVTIISSKIFIEILQKTLLDFGFDSYIRDVENPLTKRLIINKRKNSIKFLDWIYEKSNVYLNRKFKNYKLTKEYGNLKKYKKLLKFE